MAGRWAARRRPSFSTGHWKQMMTSQFQLLLASREIPINYGIEDFQADLDTLLNLGQI
jgi:hypothetical protein